MELFVVEDKAFLGRGVFGVFSTEEKAETFAEDFAREQNHLCAVRRLSLIGLKTDGDTVFAAHAYNSFYDTFVVDGIYSGASLALDAVGRKGLVIRFRIDAPEDNEIVSDL